MGMTDVVVPITAAPSFAPEPVLVDAVELARAAAVEEAGADLVGEHAGVLMEAETVATHLFTCLSPGYRGWNWAVTIARAPGFDPTVSDVVLLPGPEALVAPAWVPWSERVRPGDLGPGDVLPTPADDARLVPGYTGEDDAGVTEDEPLRPEQWELGLGRVRVLSPIGRDDAADRWSAGDFGAMSPMARQAPLECGTCGFMLAMGGSLGQYFAVCANVMSPADGRVVALTYGCGAHSEVEPESEPRATAAHDETGWDPLDLGHS